MFLKLCTWGNSLGLRIPKEIRKKLDLHNGTKVKLDIENEKIVLTPLGLNELSQKIDIKKMTQKITDNNMHTDMTDNPVGKEIW